MFLTIGSYLFLFLLFAAHLTSGIISRAGNLNKIYIATESNTTTGNANCSPDQKTQLKIAIEQARDLARTASKALGVPSVVGSQGFVGWFGVENIQDRTIFQTHHYDSVNESYSLKESQDIDWSIDTELETAPIEARSLLFVCIQPAHIINDCKDTTLLASTLSYPTDDPDYLPYALIFLCPKFFKLPSFDEAGASWARSRTKYVGSQAGTLLHEAQHVHLITTNAEQSIDVRIPDPRNPSKVVKCYSPKLCWENLKPFPDKKRKNAQNFRFFAQDAYWAPSYVIPPVQPLELILSGEDMLQCNNTTKGTSFTSNLTTVSISSSIKLSTLSKPSRFTTSSTSSLSLSTSTRQFEDPGNNSEEDLNIDGLSPSECFSLGILCSVGPQISVVTSDTINTTLSTSSTFSKTTLTITEAITTDATTTIAVTATITSIVTQRVTTDTTTVSLPDTCTCSCFYNPQLPMCNNQCGPADQVKCNYLSTWHRDESYNSQPSSLLTTGTATGTGADIYERETSTSTSFSTVTEIIITSLTNTITSINSDSTTSNTYTSFSTTTITILTTTTESVQAISCTVCKPGTC